ncbi:SPW repeat protein [Bosea sp. 2YAB26]|uniref:SPW repeat protein n=1 Tax=Bosea sp. 2YAB26 TaxID=3237478 RepID=UPI003F91C3FF
MLTANTEGKRPQDLCNLLLAACLFISPWIMRFTGDMMAARNAWIIGIVLALVAVAALSMFKEWEEWVNLVLGVWLMAAPWVLGFTGNFNAFWTHTILGVLTAAVSAWAVWDYRHEPHATA